MNIFKFLWHHRSLICLFVTVSMLIGSLFMLTMNSPVGTTVGLTNGVKEASDSNDILITTNVKPLDHFFSYNSTYQPINSDFIESKKAELQVGRKHIESLELLSVFLTFSLLFLSKRRLCRKQKIFNGNLFSWLSPQQNQSRYKKHPPLLIIL